MPDAVVVGAGPNGLAAAIELARAGLSVELYEANETIGGAARTEELTLPGFHHDVGSAIYPLGVGSPFFSSLPLSEHGLEWIHPDAPLAHPFDDGRVATLERDLERTVDELGIDGRVYRDVIGCFARMWTTLVDHTLDTPVRIPRAPIFMARFGRHALAPATSLVKALQTREGRALFGGNAAHAGTPLEHRLTSGIGITLMAAGHAVGWPLPKGGAGALTGALASYFESIGGKIATGHPVTNLSELPEARAYLLGVTHRTAARITGDRLPERFRSRLTEWRYGPGAFKVDWALDGPIPWTSPEVGRAATVHLGGTFEEITASEREPWEGRVSDRPFVLLAQPTLFDPSRAPEGKHTAWAYCHVPNGWEGDETDRIEAQIERFAPGFRDRVLGRAVHNPAELEAWNANLVGGDVNGGAATLGQIMGPTRWTLDPWGTPVKGLYLCSASTPPGGGVHGMAGYHAARSALRRTFGIS